MKGFAFVEPSRYKFLPCIYWGKKLEFTLSSAAKVEGYRYTCFPKLKAVKKICLRAEKQGAKIVGFNPSWSELVELLQNDLKIPLAAGLNYGVIALLAAIEEEVKSKGHNYHKLEFVITSLENNLTRICALILAQKIRYLTLVGEDESLLIEVAEELLRKTGISVNIMTDISRAVKRGDILIGKERLMTSDFSQWGFKEALILSLAEEDDILLERETLALKKIEKINCLAAKYGFTHYRI